MDERAMLQLSYGLFVLTAKEGEKDNGCIINTATQVTASPNRISVAVNKSNLTHDMVVHTGQLTLSILSEAADFEIFKRFGFQNGRETDKFAGYEGMARGANGIYYVTEGTNAYISAKVSDTIDLGSHSLFIAEVTDMEMLSEIPSATYAYYHKNIKPKPEKASETPEGKTIWRCTICGYEYEGEDLPEDFICPLCKHPASDFEKVVM